MYDLVPPNMKAQFNSINKANQRIKLLVDLAIKPSMQKGLKEYKYNKIIIFKYSLNIKNSQFELYIYPENTKSVYFYKTVIGSFVYDISIKYSVTEININTLDKINLELLVFGFLKH